MHGAAISLWRGTSKVYRKTLCSQPESLGRRQSERAAAVWPKGLAQWKKIAMSIIGAIFLRSLLLAIFFGAYVYLTYGKEGRFPVPVARHLSWNDFITQILYPHDSREVSLKKELPVIQRFLKEHETETNVGVYDLAVFRVDQPGLSAATYKTLRNDLQRIASQAQEVTREIYNAPALQ